MANSGFFTDSNTDNLHHWKNQKLTLLCCFNIPFSKADTAGKACNTLRNAGGVLGNHRTGGKMLLFSSSLGTGKRWRALLCLVHILVFLWSTEKFQERNGLRRADGPLAEWAGCLTITTTLHAPSALLQRLQHDTIFSAVQRTEEAFLPSSTPSQPTYFFHSCHSAPRAHPFEITNYPPLPSCSSLATAWFPTQIASWRKRWLQFGQKAH